MVLPCDQKKKCGVVLVVGDTNTNIRKKKTASKKAMANENSTASNAGTRRHAKIKALEDPTYSIALSI